MLNYRSVLSCLVIAILLSTLFCPMAGASVIYGPEQFVRNSGAAGAVSSQFSAADPDGNYTLYVRNGDIINGSGDVVNGASSAIVRLNGNTLFSTKDFNQNTYLLKRNVALRDSNNLSVEVRSMPGSYLAIWVEDESPDLVITTPWDDQVSRGAITLSGYVLDRNITSLTLEANNVTSIIPVADGNFSQGLTIDGPTRLVLSARDSMGMVRTATLCLDGDYLPEAEELSYCFDPLNPDSDSALTGAAEAGNGIPDGFEVLGGQNAEKTRLPLFVKAKIGGDPFEDDTDRDGLSDYFELLRLGLLTDVASDDTDGNGITDALEDPDHDGLTNLEEQAQGTDPLLEDTDGDGLSDKHELAVSHTNATCADPDQDGLTDASELRLRTNPFVADSDDDGTLDGAEIYTSTASDQTLGISVSVTGKGDVAKDVAIHQVKAEYYTNVSALVSQLADVRVNGSFSSARVTMQYDPALNPANLSLCYYDESRGLYVPVASQVDRVNHTISANVDHLSMWGVFEVKNLQALYKMVYDFNNEPYYGEQLPYPQPGDTLVVPYDSTLTMTYLGGTAGYDNRFGLSSPFQKQYGTGHGTMPGTSFNLGTFTQGTELIFFDDNGVGNTWLSGAGGRNPDGIAHAYIKPITSDTWLLGWEDLYGGGDRDYDDVVMNLTFTRTGELKDTDEDGLPDEVETHGFMDSLGRVYRTLPGDWDTDDDGLSDGDEAGIRIEENGLHYYKLLSNPMVPDTDGDGLEDGQELGLGTNPFYYDTDYDLISDKDDSEPLTPIYISLIVNDLTMKRDVIVGAIFGDTGDEGGLCHWLVGDMANSPYYLVGAILGGFIPVADLRDLIQSLVNMDLLGSAINAAGFVPIGGDAVKITSTIGVFMVKHADDSKYLIDVTKALSTCFLRYMPDYIYKPVYGALTNNQVDRLLSIGIDWNTIMRLGSEGKNLNELASHTDRLLQKGVESEVLKDLITGKKCNLGETFYAFSHNGDVVWLEKGLSDAEAAQKGLSNGRGWSHIYYDHVKDYNSPDNEFASAFGDQYRSMDSIQGLVYESVRQGKTSPAASSIYYYKVTDTKVLKTVVGDNGYIVTSYPLDISKVPIPL